MDNIKRPDNITKEQTERKPSQWIGNFFMMGGWILVLIVLVLACAAIRTIFNY